VKLSKIIPERYEFIIITYLLAGFLFTCISSGISLYLNNLNLDFFVKYLLASYLLAFPVTFLVAFKRAGKKRG